MKRFTKYAAGAALVLGAALFAAPASAAVSVGIGFGGYGYSAPRGVVCDPYSRFYDPFYCTSPYSYYAPSYYGGGPLLSFGFNSGFHGRNDWRGGRNDWHGNDRGHWNGGGHNGGGRHH